MPEFSPVMKIVMGVLGLAILASIIYAFIKLKFLRGLAVVFMSLTAAFTLMGGAGTTCVALNPSGFGGKFSGIAPFQWLWILFVLIGVAAGIMGVRAVVMLVRAKKHAYRDALIALIIGTVINAIHLYASRALRGGSLPVDMVLYVNLLTLFLFIIFRIPDIWDRARFEQPDGNDKAGKQAASIALGAVGMLSLTIQFLMAPTHTIGGINYANVWHTAMTAIGLGLIFIGSVIAVYIEVAPMKRQSFNKVLEQ